MNGEPLVDSHTQTMESNTPDMTKDEIQKVQQALMLAEMFFLATPFDVIKKAGNPLGDILAEAVGITLKYTD